MTIPLFWNADWSASEWAASLINHLWQSTVVVAIAWLLALALRKNHARARYWVWLAASVKFLLPFWLLMTAGESLRSCFATPIVAKPALASAMEQMAEPFPQTQFFDATQAPVTAHHGNLLPALLLAIWICGVLIVVFRFVRGWLRVYFARRTARPLALAADVPVLCSISTIEPGIFGIFRPVLLLPEGILDRLTPEQLSAIVAHEMCHVRRRDNLTFVIHMIVEMLFWFYPPVWWIGARLIEERERACDEAVLQSGSEAENYAEGILNVCKFYVESPLECVAGVTGSDLKLRIARIMTGRRERNLSLSRKVLLTVVGFLVVMVPVAIGLVYAGRSLAQSNSKNANTESLQFEVATIKPSKQDSQGRGVFVDGRRFEIRNSTLSELISFAYGLHTKQIIGVPEWGEAARFDITAEPDGEGNPSLAQLRIMTQRLLIDRFRLAFHGDKRDLPAYVLSIGKSGQHLSPSKDDPNGLPAVFFPHQLGSLVARNAGMADFSREMQNAVLDRPIVDQTGLTGRYDFTLNWTPDDSQFARLGATPVPDNNTDPPLYTAIQEQLGLKLEATKAPVDVLVIDHVERPSPN